MFAISTPYISTRMFFLLMYLHIVPNYFMYTLVVNFFFQMCFILFSLNSFTIEIDSGIFRIDKLALKVRVNLVVE